MNDTSETLPFPQPSPEPRSSNRGCLLALFFFASLLLVVVIGMVGLLFVSLRNFGGNTPVSVDKGSVLSIELTGPLAEAPPEVELPPFLGGSPTSIWDLRRALRAAANDPKIAGVELWIHDAAFGWSMAEEIAHMVGEFRESGKPVYAMLEAEMVSDLDYFVAATADRIWMTPETMSAINGLVAEAQFHRGTLEKLHIKPQVIMYKEYKSAGESYANYEMSPYMRESLQALLDTIDQRFVEHVTSRRPTNPDALRQLMSVGLGTAQDLLEANLVDVIGYRDEIESAFVEQAGLRSFETVSLHRYVRSLGDGRPRFGKRIAVVLGEGIIVAAPVDSPLPFFGDTLFSGHNVAALIREAADNDDISAIVFRVNSPGGSAVGSDLVRREIERARERKPVVVSMSDVAASGGYWVSMQSDGIVVYPTTITGSIGVVFTKFDLDGFYEWIGTNTERISTAPNADMLNFGPWDDSDFDRARNWMDKAYEDFTRGVAKGRNLPIERVQEIARGRVWSGRDAVELGLADRIGTFDDAVAMAREKAGIDPGVDLPVVLYPPPKPFFQTLFGEEWSAQARTLAQEHSLQRWVEALARPQVQTVVPSIRIR